MENSETDQKEVGKRVLSPPRLQHEAIVIIEHDGIVSEEPPTLNRVSEEEMEQEEMKENVGLANTNVAVVTGMLKDKCIFSKEIWLHIC